jgi:hypothetical protein
MSNHAVAYDPLRPLCGHRPSFAGEECAAYSAAANSSLVLCTI